MSAHCAIAIIRERYADFGDRLVKELRLRGTSTREAANAFAPHFIADFKGRFAKAPRRDFNGHRPLRADEDLDLIFAWREQRKVSLSLT